MDAAPSSGAPYTLADRRDPAVSSRSATSSAWPALFAPLHDFLLASLTAAPTDGEAPSVDAARSHLSLLSPGTPLCAADFVNPWSPKNPGGDALAAERLARLSDSVPSLASIHTESGQSLDKVYGRLVCAEVFSDPSAGAIPSKSAQYVPRTRFFASRRPADQVGLRPVVPTRAAPQQAVRVERAPLSRLQMLSPAQISLQAMAALPTAAREAAKQLVHEGVDYDGAGARVKVLENSPRYEEYLQHKLRYESAMLQLVSRQRSLAASDAADRQRWEAEAPSLESAAAKLRKLLSSNEARQVETAVQTRDAAIVRGGSIGVLFDAARLRYELTKRRGIQDPYSLWHACQAAPGNWCEPDAEYAEARIVLGSSSDAAGTERGERAHRVWRIGSPRPGSWIERELSPHTRELRVSFSFQRVQIVRPWFQSTLLALGSWSHSGQKRNTYSSGSGTENTGSFPLLPVAMIVARDIEISADWGPEDQELITSCIAEGRRLALGPFALSGSYGSPREVQIAVSQHDRTIRVPGLQLLGWLSELVPASPPLDG